MEQIIVDFKGTVEEAYAAKSIIVKTLIEQGNVNVTLKNNKSMDLGGFMHLIEEELGEVGIDNDVASSGSNGEVNLFIVK